MMKMSENGKQLLAEWEGVEYQVYKDSAGLDTIGVGHLLTKQEVTTGQIRIGDHLVDYRAGLNHAQVLSLLAQDLARFENALNENVSVSLNQHQFDALLAFCFNIGVSAFKSSTLLKELNLGHYSTVPGQLGRWVNAGGKQIAGLVNRRNKEITLWNS